MSGRKGDTMPDLRERLAETLYEAVRDHAPVVPYRPWASASNRHEKSAWRDIAADLLASEEWRELDAVIEAAGDYADQWRLCHEREDDLGPAAPEDYVQLANLRGVLFAALGRLARAEG